MKFGDRYVALDYSTTIPCGTVVTIILVFESFVEVQAPSSSGFGKTYYIGLEYFSNPEYFIKASTLILELV